jgi:hypothetical protein
MVSRVHARLQQILRCVESRVSSKLRPFRPRRTAVRNSNLLALPVEGKHAFNISQKGNQQMNSTVSFRKIILAAIVSVASVGLSFAGSNTSFNGDRETVAWNASARVD